MGLENLDTICFGLRTKLSRAALNHEPIVGNMPPIQEWLSFESVAKDQAFIKIGSFIWFASIERSMKKILKGRELMQRLRAYSMETVFSLSGITLLYTLDKQALSEQIGFAHQDILYLVLDQEQYDKHHIVIRLPNTDLLLNDSEIAKGYCYYTHSLSTATRRTASIGFQYCGKRGKDCRACTAAMFGSYGSWG